MAVALGAARRRAGRRGVVAAPELDGGAPRWPRAIDRVGAVSNPIITIYREREVGFACRQARGARPGRARRRCAASTTASSRRTVRDQAPDLEHVRDRACGAGVGPACARVARGRPDDAAAAVAARAARRVRGLLHLGHDRGSEGRAAHAVDAGRGAALPRARCSRQPRTTAACCSFRSPTSAVSSCSCMQPLAHRRQRRVHGRLRSGARRRPGRTPPGDARGRTARDPAGDAGRAQLLAREGAERCASAAPAPPTCRPS